MNKEVINIKSDYKNNKGKEDSDIKSLETGFQRSKKVQVK